MKIKSIGGMISVFVIAVVLYIIFALIMGAVVAMLWNVSIAVAVSGIAELTWAQGAAILILCNLLFNSSAAAFNKK